MRCNSLRLDVSNYLRTFRRGTGGKRRIQHNFRRYFSAVKEIEALWRTGNKSFEMLDIGTSPFTFLIKQIFPQVAISTVDLTSKLKARCTKKDIIFKRCDLIKENIPFPAQRFDVVTFLEVIEHLLTDHRKVIKEIKRVLKPEGLLILQTPNWSCLRNRICVLLGKNIQTPLEFLLSSTPTGNVHIREYSKSEVVSLLEKGGFCILRAEFKYYFDELDSILVYRRNKFLSLLPALVYSKLTYAIKPFRRGIQVVAQK